MFREGQAEACRTCAEKATNGVQFVGVSRGADAKHLVDLASDGLVTQMRKDGNFVEATEKMTRPRPGDRIGQGLTTRLREVTGYPLIAQPLR